MGSLRARAGEGGGRTTTMHVRGSNDSSGGEQLSHRVVQSIVPRGTRTIGKKAVVVQSIVRLPNYTLLKNEIVV